MSSPITQVINIKTVFDTQGITNAESAISKFASAINSSLGNLKIDFNTTNVVTDFESLLNIVNQFNGSLQATLTPLGEMQRLLLSLNNVKGLDVVTSFTELNGKIIENTEQLRLNTEQLKSLNEQEAKVNSTRKGSISTLTEYFNLQKRMAEVNSIRSTSTQPESYDEDVRQLNVLIAEWEKLNGVLGVVDSTTRNIDIGPKADVQKSVNALGISYEELAHQVALYNEKVARVSGTTAFKNETANAKDLKITLQELLNQQNLLEKAQTSTSTKANTELMAEYRRQIDASRVSLEQFNTIISKSSDGKLSIISGQETNAVNTFNMSLAELEKMLNQVNVSTAKLKDTQAYEAQKQAIASTKTTLTEYMNAWKQMATLQANNSNASETLQFTSLKNAIRETTTALTENKTATGEVISKYLLMNSSTGEVIVKTGQLENLAKALGQTTEQTARQVQEFNTQLAKTADSKAETTIRKLIQAQKELQDAEYELAKMTQNSSRYTSEAITEQQGLVDIRTVARQNLEANSESVMRNSEYVRQSNDLAQEQRVRLASLESPIQQVTNGFFSMAKAVIASGISWKIFSTITGLISTTIQNIKDLDAAMIEVAKVTDMTSQEFAKFKEEAFELGETVGRTGVEVMEAVATFSRAGYSISEAMNLSEMALIMTNVADGIDNVEDAATSMIAILKGYGKEVSDANEVLDIMNEVFLLASNELYRSKGRDTRDRAKTCLYIHSSIFINKNA